MFKIVLFGGRTPRTFIRRPPNAEYNTTFMTCFYCYGCLAQIMVYNYNRQFQYFAGGNSAV